LLSLPEHGQEPVFLTVALLCRLRQVRMFTISKRARPAILIPDFSKEFKPNANNEILLPFIILCFVLSALAALD
jgi:hypothetical protein